MENEKGNFALRSQKEKVILIPARLLDIIKELCKDDNKINTSKDYSNSLFNFSQKEITEILENEFILTKKLNRKFGLKDNNL